MRCIGVGGVVAVVVVSVTRACTVVIIVDVGVDVVVL